MKLYEAIAYTIQKEGIEIIGKPQFVNYLADLQAYEIPAVKRIVRAIVHEGYSLKLQEGLQNNANELAYNDVLYQLTHFAGFQEEMVRFVLNSLLYANDRIDQEPAFEYNCPPVEKPQASVCVVSPKPAGLVTKKAIEEFFDLEAEAEKARWEANMKLSLKDRIRKRKAIKDVYLDKNYRGSTDDNYDLIKVSVGVNLSDFKEGECLFLHTEESMYGIKCRLNAFEDDHTILLEVFPPDMPSDLDSYQDVPLVLDKDKVDLRQYVYYPFVSQLPGGSDSFWKKLILNSCPKPAFGNISTCEGKLEDTIKTFNLSLLPKQKEAVLKCMEAKDYYLVQGPPGTGKSYVLGLIMLEEVFDLKHNVIVIGPNHMAINNAMGQFLKFMPRCNGLLTKVGQSYNAPTIKVKCEEEEYGIPNVQRLNVQWAQTFNSKHNMYWIIGLTPHCLYTSRARGLECDTLIIDEAGQMTIPLALMGMIKAKKVIFAGDHKQLPPIVSSDQVKPELKQSVFQALISDENCTMLDTSFRMCKPICDYVSELFYDGILKSIKSGCGDALICEDPLYSFDHPVILHEVMDDGEQVSDKEAGFIADTVAGLIERGINAEEIGVLAPFRAQAATIRRAIRKHKGIKAEDAKKITSDTVDKMQGQEREVILYSLVSGNIDYMTEMAEFLYNPNKMNVAFSRAKSKLIIVGSLTKIANLVLPQYPHISKMLNSKHALKL
ncbi:MAG: DEAD/DEAH box helicase [Parabacteroides sp.]